MYAVIDTNVIVASLKTRHHDSATVRVMDAVYSGQVTPIVNDEILAEYREVMKRPRLKLDPAKCEYIIALIDDLAERFAPASSAPRRSRFLGAFRAIRPKIAPLPLFSNSRNYGKIHSTMSVLTKKQEVNSR